MTTVNTNQLILPSDPAARKEIQDTLFEISASYTRMEGEKDYIKEAIKAASEKHQIPKKLFTKLARAYHKSSFASVLNENEDFQALVEAIVPESV
jgi:hypothetical protein